MPFLAGMGIFLCPTGNDWLWVLPCLSYIAYWAMCLGIRRLGCKAERSSPFIAKVKNAESYNSNPHTFYTTVLIYAEEHLYLTLHYIFLSTEYIYIYIYMKAQKQMCLIIQSNPKNYVCLVIHHDTYKDLGIHQGTIYHQRQIYISLPPQNVPQDPLSPVTNSVNYKNLDEPK
jgi:hypothetical protein